MIEKLWKLICWFRGHKEYLQSTDKMRYICPRCGYRQVSLNAIRGCFKGKEFSKLVQEYITLENFRQFQDITSAIKE